MRKLGTALSDVRALVTGAGGFIGSHLVERLLTEGAEVTALVRYNSRNDKGWLNGLEDPRLTIAAGDLAAFNSLSDLMEGQEICFHLGALIGIPYSYTSPAHVFQTNVMGTLNVVQACRRAGVRRFVHTSTSEVYGSPDTVPITERHALKGQSPYSASKIGADKLVESYHLSFGFPSVTIRPFNTFGPRQSLRAVLPTIIAQALRDPWIELGSLWPRRDLTFVSDTVDGFLRGALVEGVEGETFNLGTGEDVSIGDLAQMVMAIVGVEKEVRVREERIRPEASEVVQLLSDNAFARDQLDWTPTTTLRDGVGQTVRWCETHLGELDSREYVT